MAIGLEFLALLAQNEPPVSGWDALWRGPLPLLVVLGLLGYLMLFRPERKRRDEHEAMLNSLKKNDRIETIGGIFGTIVSVNREADEVVIKVDESSNTRLRVRCSAIRAMRETTKTAAKPEEG
jgi:preprotein translocase subunit YajC